MSELVTKKHAPPSSNPTPSEDEYDRALHRSKEALDHLQDLLERSDQKANFAVAGVAFLSGFFVQQVSFNPIWTTAALSCFGIAFLCICVTALPRKFNWYRAKTVRELEEGHLAVTSKQELHQRCSQEADLRQVYWSKNLFLMTGFVWLMAGMVAMLAAVWLHYIK
ncbi:MAG TPA: hypothetical protein VMR98_02570 [Candidatus Polarisedimenticolaceae bacterium]|nr:hypothetical protein [Candidatus Polarisedimenticolaceae bacterium]